MKPRKPELPLVSSDIHEDWRRRRTTRAEKLTYLTFFLAASELLFAIAAQDMAPLIVSFLIMFVSGFAILDF